MNEKFFKLPVEKQQKRTVSILVGHLSPADHGGVGRIRLL